MSKKFVQEAAAIDIKKCAKASAYFAARQGILFFGITSAIVLGCRVADRFINKPSDEQK